MYFDIKNEIKARKLPDLFKFSDGTDVNSDNVSKRRMEMLEILQKNVYGYVPDAPDKIDFYIEKIDDTRCCAGKAIYKEVRITFPINDSKFSFPVKIMMPKAIKKAPFAVIANFRGTLPDEYIPSEELIDRGIGFGVFCYTTDITSDDNDFSSGISGKIYKDGIRKSGSDCGKIAMWAYCASRVLDYAINCEDIDREKTAVAGHSRLGKSALLASACDERFKYVFSNNSGCAGAAVSRGKKGETVKNITDAFPYWFCKNYVSYAENEEKMPCDQHFLLAATAPRKVYVASAAEDFWADPLSEYISCIEAGQFWRLYGKDAFPYIDSIPKPGDIICGSNIGYHIRSGVHFLSRYDWNAFLNFFLKQ